MHNLTINYNFNNNINFKSAKQNTIKVASNQRRKLNFVKEEVMEQIKTGLSISDLAKFYKCNIKAIKLFLYKNSLIKELNKKNHSNKKDFNSIEKELTECVKENKKVTEMATYFNLTPVTIIRYLNKSGLIDDYKIKHNLSKKTAIDIKQEDLITLMRNGKKIEDIAMIYNCHKTTIYKYVNKYGLLEEYLKIRETKVTENKLTKLMREAKKIVDIATELNCCLRTIYTYINKYGLMSEYQSLQRKKVTRDSIIKLIKEGKRVPEIAKELNCTESTVYSYLKKNKLFKLYKKYHSLNITKKNLNELIRNGLKISDIAKKYKCPPSNIKYYIYKYELINEYKKMRIRNKNLKSKKKLTKTDMLKNSNN